MIELMCSVFARQYDYIVLATDGLTDKVRADEIHHMMYSTN